jgi:hypothetical protein
MAVQILEQGPRNLVVKVSGTAGANTLDVSTLTPPCEDLRVMKIIYDSPIDPTAVTTITGDATADVTLFTLSGPGDTYCFHKFGGLVNNAGAGKTGDVIVTTGDDAVTVVLHLRKVRTQSPFPN